MKIDLFGGTGFVGSNFARLYPKSTYVHPREDDLPIHKEVLYMISTTHNYNFFDDIYKDVNTNLIKTLKVLSNCKNKDFVFNYILYISFRKINPQETEKSTSCAPF